jgi:hypothetical protein
MSRSQARNWLVQFTRGLLESHCSIIGTNEWDGTSSLSDPTAFSGNAMNAFLTDVNPVLTWLSAIWCNQKPNGQERELPTGNTAMCADATHSFWLALQQDFERQCARAVAPAAGDPA